MDTRNLRACPYCAAAPKLIQLDVDLWIVNCESCRAIGPHPEATQDEATAIRLWNGRQRNRQSIELAAVHSTSRLAELYFGGVSRAMSVRDCSRFHVSSDHG